MQQIAICVPTFDVSKIFGSTTRHQTATSPMMVEQHGGWSTRLKFSPLVKTDEHSGWHVPTGNSFCNHANQINLGTPVSQGRTQLVLIKKCPKCPWPGLPAGAKKSPHLCINYRGVSPLQGKRYPHFSMEIEWASTTQSQTRNWKRFFNYVVIDFVCFLWNPPSGLALSGRTSG